MYIHHQRAFFLFLEHAFLFGCSEGWKVVLLNLSSQVQVRDESHELELTLMDKDVLSSVFVLIHLPFSRQLNVFCLLLGKA